MEKLIVDLVVGALGGNAAGAATPNKSLGAIGDTVTGLLGGVIGSQILEKVVGNAVTGMTGDILGAGLSGALALYIVNWLKKYLFNKAA
jgi:uncharacterized membrane protein YeaQ/YmgE (transglycosylase-associated protein family)